MKETKLLPLFLSQSLRSVAVSLLSFFSAVYIYKQFSSLLLVFGFFLVLYIFKIIGVSLAENLALKFGLKKQVILGHFLTALTLLSFAGSKNNFSFLWWAAIFWGLAIGFFWFGRHSLVVKIGETGRYGRALGFSSLLEHTLLLGSPFLGGLIITEFGYSNLFLFALFFILLALLALQPLKDQKTHQDVTLSEVIRLLLAHPRTTIAYVSLGVLGSIYSGSLILYIFLNIKKELALGAFFSLSMVLVAIINYFICRMIDLKGKTNLIAGGATMTAFVWLGRFLANNYATLFVLDVFGRIAGSMTGFPLEVLTYQKAVDGSSTGRAILFRELAVIGGEIFGVLLLMGLILLHLPLKSAFLLAIPFALAKLLIVKKDGIYGETG